MVWPNGATAFLARASILHPGRLNWMLGATLAGGRVDNTILRAEHDGEVLAAAPTIATTPSFSMSMSKKTAGMPTSSPALIARDHALV